ncbi:MAG: tRNA 2-thiocytidine(32) synthetase TtcA [Myxococcota bacterium]
MSERAPDLDPIAERRALEDKLAVRLQKTSQSYGLLERGDRVMVCLSGGKDSYTLLHLLMRVQKRLPFAIELIAVHLDQKQPGYDGRGLVGYLESTGVPFEILSEDTYSVVTAHIPEGKTYCSMCSRLRRGILYTAAERLGANKIALGHHREDTLETFLMNLFYAGKMQAMPAKYTTDDGRFQVIRPLIECAEAEIARFAELQGFPIIPCNLCGSQTGLKREAMGQLLTTMEATHPNLRAVMLNALRNVRPTHLLDQDVQAAWEARAPEIRPDEEKPGLEPHFSAEPVQKGGSKLRILNPEV